MNRSHNLSNGHDYDALDDEEGCAPCRRENVMERNVDEAITACADCGCELEERQEKVPPEEILCGLCSWAIAH